MVKKKSSAIVRKPTKTKTTKKVVKKALGASQQSAEAVEEDVETEDLDLVEQVAAPAAMDERVAPAKPIVETPAVAPASTSPAVATSHVPAATQSVVAPRVAEPTTLAIELTEALLGKLKRSAQEEGVDLNTLVHELLTEGVTLRAWEIIERKNAMRAPSQSGAGYQQPGQHRNGGGHNNRRNNNNNRRGGNGNPGNGTAWMEDKAQFLEYVRNQEKRRR